MIDFVDSIEKQGFTIDNPNADRLLRLRRLVPLIASPRRPEHDDDSPRRSTGGGCRASGTTWEAPGPTGGQSRCRCSALAIRAAASEIRMSRLVTSRG